MTVLPNRASAESGSGLGCDKRRYCFIVSGNLMLRKCCGCGSTVSRKDCHKNRYGQYICRTCQAAGLKFTRGARLRYWWQRTPSVIIGSLTGMALMALAIWALYAVVLGLGSIESFEFFWSPEKH